MIIKLSKSILFTTDPDIRFTGEYKLPRGVWTELWRRYKLLDYDIQDLCDFYEIRTKRKMSCRTMGRWIWRTEVYSMTKPLIKMGTETVMSHYFKEYEVEVIKEIMKNIKSSVNKNPKILV